MNISNKVMKDVSLPIIKKLKSGLKLITMERPCPIKSIGVFIKAGSRYSSQFPQGITQMIKRTALKGTSSKTTEFELMSYVDSLGGEMMCEIQRDLAVYFTKFYSNDIGNMFSTLSEAIFQPIITDEEVNLQKKLLSNELELREYNTELDPKFFDYIMESCFYKNTMGLRETPTTDSLDNITKESFYKYFSSFYQMDRMSIAGINIPQDMLYDLCEKYFDCNNQKIWPSQESSEYVDNSIAQYTGGYSYLHEPNPRKQPGHVVLPELVYISLGFEGCNEQSDEIYPLAVLFSLIGQGKSFSVGGPGKGMYNRVNRNILNKYYWVNSCEAFVQSFEDTGVFTIYGSCDPMHASDFVNVILSEYYKIINEPIDKIEFNRAKRQLLSQLIMNLEISNMALEDLGRQALYGNRYKCWPELFDKVNQVTVQDVKNCCYRLLQSNPSVAAMGNLTKMPTFDNIKEAVTTMKPINNGSRWFY